MWDHKKQKSKMLKGFIFNDMFLSADIAQQRSKQLALFHCLLFFFIHLA